MKQVSSCSSSSSSVVSSTSPEDDYCGQQPEGEEDEGVVLKALELPSSSSRIVKKVAKRRVSAYTLFFQHERQLAINKLKGDERIKFLSSRKKKGGFSAMAAAIAAKWKALPQEERAYYENLVHKSKARRNNKSSSPTTTSPLPPSQEQSPRLHQHHNFVHSTTLTGCSGSTSTTTTELITAVPFLATVASSTPMVENAAAATLSCFGFPNLPPPYHNKNMDFHTGGGGVAQMTLYPCASSAHMISTAATLGQGLHYVGGPLQSQQQQTCSAGVVFADAGCNGAPPASFQQSLPQQQPPHVFMPPCEEEEHPTVPAYIEASSSSISLGTLSASSLMSLWGGDSSLTTAGTAPSIQSDTTSTTTSSRPAGSFSSASPFLTDLQQQDLSCSYGFLEPRRFADEKTDDNNNNNNNSDEDATTSITLRQQQEQQGGEQQASRGSANHGVTTTTTAMDEQQQQQQQQQQFLDDLAFDMGVECRDHFIEMFAQQH